MLMNLKRLKNRGDTIVEVMIVLAVLGFAISISYATANRSLLNVRQAQETAEASRIAQTQVERLRVGAKSVNPAPLYAGGSNFCLLDYSGGISAGSSCTQGIYTTAITYDTSANDPFGGKLDTFRIQVTWDDVSRGTDSLTLFYRVHR